MSRNCLCPHYAFCLDEAAHINEVFTCHSCPDETRHEPAPITEQELPGVLSLMSVLFGRHPDILRAELFGPRPWAPILPGEIIA